MSPIYYDYQVKCTDFLSFPMWYATFKAHCQREGLWEYVDPSTDTVFPRIVIPTELESHTLLRELSLADWKREHNDSEEGYVPPTWKERRYFHADRVNDCAIRLPEHQKKITALDEIHTWVNKTVPPAIFVPIAMELVQTRILDGQWLNHFIPKLKERFELPDGFLKSYLKYEFGKERRPVDSKWQTAYLQALSQAKVCGLEDAKGNEKEELEPSRVFTKDYARQKYKAVLRKARHTADAPKWHTEYIQALSYAKAYDLEEAKGYEAVRLFLTALQYRLAPDWATREIQNHITSAIIRKDTLSVEHYSRIYGRLLFQDILTAKGLESGRYFLNTISPDIQSRNRNGSSGSDGHSPDFQCPCETISYQHSWPPLTCRRLRQACNGTTPDKGNPLSQGEAKRVLQRLGMRRYKKLIGQLIEKKWLPAGWNPPPWTPRNRSRRTNNSSVYTGGTLVV